MSTVHGRISSAALGVFVGVSILASTVGCASEDAHFDVRFAPGFEHQGVSLSVLGVFKNGRMSTEAWDAIGSKLSPVMGKKTCDVAYAAGLLGTGLATAIDDYTQENGVTDDLLEQLGPVATGNAILTITVAGEVPAAPPAGSGASATTPAPQPQPTMGRGGRGGRGGRRRRASASPESSSAPDRDTFEISASVYSIRPHRSVALIGMTYSGRSVDEAVDKFRQKLAKELPGATCAGWDWNVEIDEGRIRGMGER